MEKELKHFFINKWRKYFGEAELPIVFFYADEASEDDIRDSKDEHRCLVCNLNRVREGQTFVYHSESSGCLG